MIGSRAACLTSIGLFVGLTYVATEARAQELVPASDVSVVPPTCAAASETFVAFVDALRVELAGPGPRCCVEDVGGGDLGPPPAGPRVTLTFDPCERDAARVNVTVDGAGAGPAIHRLVPLGDVPPAARPRALALAVAELVRYATTRSPPVAPKSKPEPEPGQGAGAGAPPSPSTPAPGRSALTLGLGPELRSFPSRRTDLWGGRLSLAAARGGWQAALDVGGDAGGARYDAGDVSVRLLTAGAAAGPRFALGGAVADLQLGAALGWARVAGTSSQPAVSVGAGARFVAAAGARLGIEAPRGSSIHLRGSIEAGAMLDGLHAEVDGARAAGVSGLYVAVGVGGTIALGPR